MASNDQLLQQWMQSMGNSFGHTARQLDSAAAVVARFGAGAKIAADNMDREFDRLNIYNKKYDKERVRELKELSKYIAKKKKALEEEQKSIEESNRIRADAIRQARKLRKERAELLKQQHVDLNGERKKRLDQIKAELAESDTNRRRTQVEHRRIQSGLKRTADDIGYAVKQAANTRKELERFSAKDMGGMLVDKTSSAIKSMLSRAFNPALLAAGINGLMDEARQSMATGSDWAHSDPTKSMSIAKDLGITAKQYMEMNAQHRHLIHAMGGTEKHMQLIQEAAKGLEHNFATPGERTLYLAKQMEYLANAGIKPTLEVTEDLNKNMTQMQTLTGKTLPELQGFMQEITNSAEMQAVLRTTDEAGRIAQIKQLQLLTNENLARGVSLEQTRELNKARMAQGTSKASSRFQEAPQLQALMVQMGYSFQEAQKLANIYRKHENQRTAEEKLFYDKVMPKVAADFEKRAVGSTQFWHEAMSKSFSGLTDKLQPLADIQTSTEGRGALGATGAAAAGLITAGQEKVPETLSQVANALEAIKAILDSKLLWIGGGVLGILGIMQAGPLLRRGLSAARGGLGKLGGKIGGLGKGAATTGKAAASAASRIATAPVLDTILDAGDDVGKAGSKTAGKAAGKAGAKSLAKKIPVIGAIAAAGFAGDRLLDGDFKGAGMEVASGLLSMIPILGTAASLAIDYKLYQHDTAQGKDAKPVLPSQAKEKMENQARSEQAGMINNEIRQIEEKYNQKARDRIRAEIAEDMKNAPTGATRSDVDIDIKNGKRVGTVSYYGKDNVQLGSHNMSDDEITEYMKRDNKRSRDRRIDSEMRRSEIRGVRDRHRLEQLKKDDPAAYAKEMEGRSNRTVSLQSSKMINNADDFIDKPSDKDTAAKRALEQQKQDKVVNNSEAQTKLLQEIATTLKDQKQGTETDAKMVPQYNSVN